MQKAEVGRRCFADRVHVKPKPIRSFCSRGDRVRGNTSCFPSQRGIIKHKDAKNGNKNVSDAYLASWNSRHICVHANEPITFPLEHNKCCIYKTKTSRKCNGPKSLFIDVLRFLWISGSAEIELFHSPVPDSKWLRGPALWHNSLTSNKTSGTPSATHVLPSGCIHTFTHIMYGRLQNRMQTCMTSTNLILNWQSSKKTSQGWKPVWAEENLLKELTHYLQSVW